MNFGCALAVFVLCLVLDCTGSQFLNAFLIIIMIVIYLHIFYIVRSQYMDMIFFNNIY